ncbi:hypothetical protein BS78_07G035500 [Paspalum vaginatum]|nr:hypothetical protein BS78_07G035500 [Paspalum vaginatum]
MCSQNILGSLDHDEQDVKTFPSLGIGYLKYDIYNDVDSGVMERYTNMSSAMKTYGKNTFSLCEWGREILAIWAGNMGNSWTTHDDIADNWARMTGGFPMPDLVDGNDPDMPEVGNGGMSEREHYSHSSVWALAMILKRLHLLCGMYIRVGLIQLLRSVEALLSSSI